ncbi:MAG: hypothetical protein H6815_02960 [Phycisphaeraceae bacterium]|nr:hypothetical protein [Phycisphaerales bacterium]MCB9859387.1 hypothetical protein [Phycisphaeraceae bacterium]
MKPNVLRALSEVFYPISRESGIKQLIDLGILNKETAGCLAEFLSDGMYSYRKMYEMLAPVKVRLDEWMRVADYSKFRPTQSLASIKRYAQASPSYFSVDGLRGSHVLDFGAGQYSPLSIAILLYINGAETVTAFEPAGWFPDTTPVSIRELISDIHVQPDTYNFAGHNDARLLKRRLAELSFEAINQDEINLGPIRLCKHLDFQSYASSFDMILSTSVFEHVSSFDNEIQNHLTSLRPGGISINRVDFTDHRQWKPELVPFGFYRDGVPCGCNLLRVSDLADAAKKTGAMFEIKDCVLADSNTIDEEHLVDRFRGYTLTTLRTMAATLVLAK